MIKLFVNDNINKYVIKMYWCENKFVIIIIIVLNQNCTELPTAKQTALYRGLTMQRMNKKIQF